MLAGLSFIKAAWQILVCEAPRRPFPGGLRIPTFAKFSAFYGLHLLARNPMGLGFLLNLLGILLLPQPLRSDPFVSIICVLGVLYLRKWRSRAWPGLVREYFESRNRVSFLIPHVPD